MANPGYPGKTRPRHKRRDLDSEVYQHPAILLKPEEVLGGKFMEEILIKYNHYMNP